MARTSPSKSLNICVMWWNLDLSFWILVQKFFCISDKESVKEGSVKESVKEGIIRIGELIDGGYSPYVVL